MAGGYSDGAYEEAIDSTEVFCFANCKGSEGWRLTTSLPGPLQHLMGATFNGHFRVIGGCDLCCSSFSCNTSNEVLVWDPSEEMWRKDAPLLDLPVFDGAVTVTTKDLCT